VWQSERLQSADPLSALIFRVVISEFGRDLRGARVLEVGCGSGRISIGMAESGAEITLLDYSSEALLTARTQLAHRAVNAELVCGSMFQLPFQDGRYDLVWNAGVLEHYGERDQKTALSEMLRVCAVGGSIITLNPSSRAYLYRAGKYIEERLGKWKYGYEQPVASLAPVLHALGIARVREFTVGFYEQFTFLRAVPMIRFFAHHFAAWGRVHWPALQTRGGYLLATVFRKPAAAEHAPVVHALA
jgi:ubiquinone/menaquinone biosynthesis C-methylase UbiE